MTQALQFLDFRLNPAELAKWVNSPKTALELHVEQFNSDHPEQSPHQYRGMVFLDSGGYRFLSNPNLDLERFGIPRGPRAWRGVYHIQKGLGGDIYTSLDYPLRPGLVDSEAAVLIDQSLENAFRLLHELHQQSSEDWPAPFFVPCHGRTADEMQRSVSSFFGRAKAEGLLNHPLGVAIGSLVPLRTVQRSEAILSIVRGAVNAVPPPLREQTPIHVFGITGSMIPLLVYLGVDSFDSSAYVQNARSLDYYVPDRHVRTRFLELEGDELPCSCPHCRHRSLREMHSVMVGESREALSKSEVYATIALHNLYWDQDLVDRTRSAVEEDLLEEFLVEHAARYPAIRPGVEILSRGNSTMVAKLSRRHFRAGSWQEELAFPSGPIDLAKYDPGRPPWAASADDPATYRHAKTRSVRPISLKYTPDSFAIPADWTPSIEKDVLLILPCSEAKPYRESHSHRAILEFLAQRFGSVGRIQKVTLSGLYGPVPEEYEEHPAVLGYDFRLTPSDEGQIQLCASRLSDFLRRYTQAFRRSIGYGTSRAYRDVMQRAASMCSAFVVLPHSPGRQLMTEMFRRDHLDQLAQDIEQEVFSRDLQLT